MSDIYTPVIDWMIVFEDSEHDSMLFTDEDIARKAYEMKSQNWNCHLFYRVSSESGIDYPKTLIQQLQSKIAALSIAVADNDIDEVKRLLPLSGEQVVREIQAEAVTSFTDEFIAHVNEGFTERGPIMPYQDYTYLKRSAQGYADKITGNQNHQIYPPMSGDFMHECQDSFQKEYEISTGSEYIDTTPALRNPEQEKV